MNRDKIVSYCQEFLKVSTFEDWCVNGLQIEGANNVKRVVVGVSLSQALIEVAIKKRAEMILVHHGLFIDQIGKPPVVQGYIRDRLKLVLSHDINVVGFHLPLDAHPKIGNNAALCQSLGLKRIKPFDVGFIGELPRLTEVSVLAELIDRKVGTKSRYILGAKNKVRNIAVVSGGASYLFEKAARAGADAFVCGEIKESIVRAAEEVGITVINAGHYNSEKLGVQNLGKLIKQKFKLEVEWINIPCEY